MSANDKGVLRAIDNAIDVLVDDGVHHKINPHENPELLDLREARAAVAECFAERDRLRNIVRSHEAQILRMTAERAELVEAATDIAKLDRVMAGSKVAMYIPVGEARHERLRAALARFTDADFEARR